MSYLLEDLGGLVGATLLAPVLLCCAGFGLLRLLERRGLAAREGVWPRASARKWATGTARSRDPSACGFGTRAN